MTMTVDQPQAGNGESQLARRSFQPMAPIGSAGALKNLLNAQRDSIAEMLPKHITPERLFKTMLVAANRTPKLFECTQASLMETINRAAELGLDLSGTLGEAYPVPFNNKVKTPGGGEQWVTQCQLIIGYRGLAKLARQSGEIKRIDADIVCANDTFVMRKGSDARCEFAPCLRGDRGEVLGAYAYVQFRDGGEQFDFMPVADIDKVRQRSKSGSDKQGNAIGAWRSDWGEMAKKTVFRRVAKWLPLSTEKFVAAIDHESGDFDLQDVVEAETGRPGVSRVQQLRERLGAGAQPVAEPLDPQTAAEGSQVNPDADAATESPGGAQDDAGEAPAAQAAPQAPQAAQASTDKPDDAEALEIRAREALTGTWDQVKGRLRDLVRTIYGVTSKPDFEGGVLKFLTSRKLMAAADLPTTQPAAVRELYDAIVGKVYDVKSGSIVNPDAD